MYRRGMSRRPALTVAAGVLIATLTACGASTAPKVSAVQLLQKAKQTADSAAAVHFTLTSSNVSLSGTNLVGGEGDLVRPSSLRGTFRVAVSGFTANVAVVSIGSVFEAKLPFAAHYAKTNPANFGLTNPAQLLDPDKGLTSLLTVAQDPKLGPSKRVGGELLYTISYTVPGSAVPVLPDADPSKPVQLTVAVNPSNDQLRSVTLTGPLTSATSDSTFVVTLSSYNEHVKITLPPT